ncbi:MAG: hypothetical protein Q9208_008120 [Pyrenodesmia sp. 3 TL-2023]
MTSVTEIQALLRFLSQDAKVPVPLAMSKIKDLKGISITTPESLSQTPLPKIQSIFPDEKLAKQILSAAKRVSKKRTASSNPTNSSPSKRVKHTPMKPGEQLSPSDFEASVALPTIDLSKTALIDLINNTVLHTNRAPLVVAFVVQLLKYTMPSQPLTSRLSLAQAVMSIGAKSRAITLGIQSGKPAEDEGWGEGQPKIRVMGRELRVMRRWGYEWHDDHTQETKYQESVKQEDQEPEETPPTTTHDLASQETIKGDPSFPSPSPTQQQQRQPSHPQPPPQTQKDTETPLWALNLETLRSTSNTAPILSPNTTNLPIYDPHAARNYLLKSFASAPATASSPAPSSSPEKTKKTSAAKEREEKEHNLALLLHALDLLYTSWIDVIGAEELNRRAWGWYVRVRPEVENGPAGWGGRGEVRLKGILELRRGGSTVGEGQGAGR